MSCQEDRPPDLLIKVYYMKPTNRMILVLSAILLLFSPVVTADEIIDTTDDCLNRMSWLEGHWRGDGFGGVCEEIWSPGLGDTRMGMFKLVQDDKVVFYEFVVIGVVDGVLTKRLRHFNADMTGWEEKDKWIEFPFVGCTENSMEFEGLSYTRISANSIRVLVDLRDEDGNPSPVELIYHRVEE